MTPLEWISKVAPEIHNNTTQDEKLSFISVSKGETDERLFSDTSTYNLAVAYKACHLLYLSSISGESKGALILEKEGDLTKAYGGKDIGASNLNTSQYLDSYNRLLKGRVPTFYINHGY